VRARLELGLAVPAPLYINGLRLRSEALRAWQQEVMAKVDVVHAPAVAFATPTIAETDVGGGARMNDLMARATRLTRPVNYLGLPGLVLPCGFQSHGLPCGMQLIGRPFDDSLLLRLGHAYQQATDWHTRLPTIAKA
jgi:aspartyl-tRNA(Asn)/glutamyl-tRNA(Gln) amidotransferase subunit A